MLEKAVCIRSVGVLKECIPVTVDLKKVSLVYADNARGKSTLSALLQACAEGDAEQVVSRKTVGATVPQKVVLKFTAPGGGTSVSTFDGAAWGGERPRMHVFNQSFVDRNVFASTGVSPAHREALLTLALGDAAVTEREKFEHQAALQKEAAARVGAAEQALVGFRGASSVDEFIAMSPLEDADKKIEEIDKEIAEARDVRAISQRPEFKTVEVHEFNFDSIASVVASSFESLAVNAEQKAKQHFAKHQGSDTERWAAEGMRHKPDEECPFCGQETAGVELLKAYRAYFDGAYGAHLTAVSGLAREVSEKLSDRPYASWKYNDEFNKGLLSVWGQSLGIDSVPVLDFDSAMAILDSVRERLLGVVDAKRMLPQDGFDTTPFAEAVVELNGMRQIADAYNKQIAELNQQIAAYKVKTSGATALTQLTARRDQAVTRKNRYEPVVVDLIEKVREERAAHKAAEVAKDAARTALDALMASTLAQFQSAINSWLGKFGAPFVIDQLAPNYKGGGAVRTAYVLKVRGAVVNVGPGSEGELSFHTALSEGDKRTLAFAFFLARLFADPNRASAIVVLDDVFTSLDRHRRHNTIDAALKMAAECAQVITLAHDAYFLRDVKKRVLKKGLGEVVELSLERDAHDYSYLTSFDLDEYTSSEYYKHYVLVERFVNAEPCSLVEVAKALRLLVEGHLHRCFPKKFKEGMTVGDMLAQVKDAAAPNPLVKLQPLLSDLANFNDFAATFHHDTSGGYPRTEVNQAELLPFAKGALGFIQARSFQHH